MSDYIVSARKYRPSSFETLIGQDNIAKTLKNSITRGQLAHAYLFCGPRGVGKTSTARIFAKTINCSNPGPQMEPCGECESCQSFQEGRSYCIHELDAASNNSVDDIRTLTDKVHIPPQVGRYSVYIIDEVHMLSLAAFNAFLKVLEEPPAHAIFILATTEKHKIPATILSRCQTFDFNRIGISDIVRNLRQIADKEGIHPDDESLHIIARKADGAMRDALTIFDQTVAFCGTEIRYEDVIRNLNVLDYEYSFRLVDAFLSGDYASALLIFDEILSKGFNSLYFVSALGEHLRDLLVSRTAGLDPLLDYPESLKKRYAEQAARCSVKFIYDALSITTQCEAGFKASANQRLHIEYALMRLSFLTQAPSDAAQRPAAKAATEQASKESDSPGISEGISRKGASSLPSETPAGANDAKAGPTGRSEVPAEPEGISRQGASSLPSGSKAEAPKEAEPAPQAAPAPRRRTPKGASSLSLSSVMDEIDHNPAAGETPAAEVEVSEDTARQKWDEIVQGTSQPRLAIALSKARLSLEAMEAGGQMLTFTVVNEAQKRWIEEKMLHELEGRMRKLTGSSSLHLSVSVLPDGEQKAAIYMPEEKARDLMSKNDEVKHLIKDLGLDIK